MRPSLPSKKHRYCSRPNDNLLSFPLSSIFLVLNFSRSHSFRKSDEDCRPSLYKYLHTVKIFTYNAVELMRTSQPPHSHLGKASYPGSMHNGSWKGRFLPLMWPWVSYSSYDLASSGLKWKLKRALSPRTGNLGDDPTRWYHRCAPQCLLLLGIQ